MESLTQLIDHEFPVNHKMAYLNHAGVGPWPARTAEAVCRFAEENINQGAIGYEAWVRIEQELKHKFCQILNCPSIDDIALVKNTSEGLSLIAYGLSWEPGDNIVITDQEFPSNRIVWESLSRFGVETRPARLQGPDLATDSILQLIDERTRLVSISSVQYASGLVMDLQRIGQFCRQHAILFCVDAIQSLGALPLDVQQINADFIVADGHKWMLGPEGIGVFYSNTEARNRLNLTQYGWHMTEQPGNFDLLQWQEARSARRFECGSPNMLGIHALNASLSLLLEAGIDSISREIIRKSGNIIDYIKNNKIIRLLSPEAKGHYAGIVTFVHNNLPAQEILTRLAEHQIVAAVRGGGIRLSPHFYTSDERIEHTLQVIDRLK